MHTIAWALYTMGESRSEMLTLCEPQLCRYRDWRVCAGDGLREAEVLSCIRDEVMAPLYARRRFSGRSGWEDFSSLRARCFMLRIRCSTGAKARLFASFAACAHGRFVVRGEALQNAVGNVKQPSRSVYSNLTSDCKLFDPARW